MRGLVVDRSVQLVARNREARTEVKSFVHRDARYEGIMNHVSGLIIRATSCTLRGNRESRIAVESFVQQVARYEGKNLTDFKYNIFLFRTKIRFSHNRYHNIFM